MRWFSKALGRALVAWGVTASAQAGMRIGARGGDGDVAVTIEADRLVYDDRSGRLVAEGGVRVERGDAVVFAERLEIDRGRDEAVARGNVRYVDGATIVFAETMRLTLDGQWGEANGVELYLKEKVAPDLLRRLGRVRVRSAGSSRIALSAARMERRHDGRFRLDDAVITPCDCGPDEPPSFSLRAKRALLDPDEGALVSGLTLEIRDQPVIGVPATYVPFGRRRTGFLLPRVAWSPRDGFMVGDDFYIAISRSTDATLSFDYFTERGPRGGAEFRYALGPDERGRIAGSVIRDALSDNEKRFAIDATHRQSFGDRVRALAKVELVGDTHHLNDFAYAIRDRDIEYTRSSVATWWRGDDQRAGLTAEFFQDLQGGTAPKAFIADTAAIAPSRLPRFDYTLLPTRIAGPLHLRASAEALHVWKPGDPWNDANTNGAREAGEQLLKATRLFATLGLELPWSLGPIDGALAAVYTQAVTFADVAGSPFAHGNLAFAAHVETEIARSFGSTRHSILPTLDVVSAPVDFTRGGATGGASIDEIDWLTSLHRLQFGVRNRLRADTATPFLLELLLGQSVDLAAPSLGDQRARARIRVGGADFAEVRADTSFRLSPAEIVETNLSFSARVWKLGASVAYVYLLEGERERFMFEDLANPLARGIRVPLAPLATFHEITVRPEFEPIRGLSLYAVFHYSFRLAEYLETIGGLNYKSPCNCWSAGVTVMKRYNVSLPDVFVTFDLAFLGSGGIGYVRQ